MKVVNTVGIIDARIAVHEAKTTGVHGAGSDHLALFGVASQVLSKVIWKDASEQALSDLNRIASLGWTDLDLTAYTSANAKFAIVNVRVYADSVGAGGNAVVNIRKNGTTPTALPDVRVTVKKGDITGCDMKSELVCAVDTGQVLEYQIYIAGTIQVDTYIDVLGYIE